MSTKTVENLVKEMENSNIFMRDEMTFNEYVDNLISFQIMVTKLVMGEDYEEGMRVDEAIFKLEAKGREKEISRNPEFRKGIAALRTVNKEIAISLSGKKSENVVAKTLEYITRPDIKVFRNVYVSDEVDETELDAVVVTDQGIIILEVKSIKEDVNITPQGRLLIGKDACYDNKPLAEKMRLKRRLLRKKLEQTAKDNNYNIPICIDSLIVFSTPKGVWLNVNDQYHHEKWCYRRGLTNRIDNYIGVTYYSKEQLNQLNEMVGQLETQVKRFALTVNFDEIRNDIAGALVLLQEKESELSPTEEETVQLEEKRVEELKVSESKSTTKLNQLSKKQIRNYNRAFAMLASAFTGAICLSAAIGLSVLADRTA